MAYLHFDLETAASAKVPGDACGDVVSAWRTRDCTWVILADGLGHGIKANLQATLHTSRLQRLLGLNYSFREAFCTVAATVHANRTCDLPYAALIAARIRTNGEATILTYDAPNPVFLSRTQVTDLPGRALPEGQPLVLESSAFLEAGEALLLFSDGVTQAGLGQGLTTGWTLPGVVHFLKTRLREGIVMQQLGREVHDQARRLWNKVRGDDVTALSLLARQGHSLAILTGTPMRRSDDASVIRDFLATPGTKAVCGASTAKMLARHLGVQLQVDQHLPSAITPPRYFIEGIDLVTEGVITLNQVLNILDQDPNRFEPDSPVSHLARALLEADRVDFWVGQAPNLGAQDISVLQQGIQPRRVVIPLLMQLLERQGKLVTCEWI